MEGGDDKIKELEISAHNVKRPTDLKEVPQTMRKRKKKNPCFRIQVEIKELTTKLRRASEKRLEMKTLDTNFRK